MSTPFGSAVTWSGSRPSTEIAVVPVLGRHGDEVVGELRLRPSGARPRTRRAATRAQRVVRSISRCAGVEIVAGRRRRAGGVASGIVASVSPSAAASATRALDRLDQLHLGAVEVHDQRDVGPVAWTQRRAAA